MQSSRRFRNRGEQKVQHIRIPNPGKAEPTLSCSVTGEFEIEIEKVHVRVFPWNIAHELSNNLKPTNRIGLAGGSCLAARCSHLGVVWVTNPRKCLSADPFPAVACRCDIGCVPALH